MSDTAFKNMTTGILKRMSGHRQLTYHGESGAVLTYGYLPQRHDYFGDEEPISSNQRVALLDLSDIGQPKEGDFVVDPDGVSWRLINRLDADEWMETWKVIRK